MKKILLLENKGEVSYYLEKDLSHKGNIVFEALDVLDALSIINDEKNIDCYILDLNLRSEGLTEEEEEQTKGGLITGWIWFKNYVLSSKPEDKNKCIIYSDYLGPLKKYVSAQELSGVHLVPKRGTGREEYQLDEAINKILQ